MTNFKEKLENLDYKFLTTTILLLVIVGFEVSREIRYNHFADKAKSFKIEKGKVLRDKQKEKEIEDGKFVIDGFTFFEKTRETKNKFILNVRVPKELTKEDVKIDIRGSVLKISFEIANSKKTKDGDSSSFIHFERIYTLPTDGTNVDDVKLEVENGRLKLEIPTKESK
jgi:HSP20 family molecular chaperone IbpA